MAGKEILRGVDLVVRSGEVHAVMGPNGSGKSTLAHVLMGRPGYEVTGGSVPLDGVDLLALAPWERAQAGLFLALQYPTEVPGVSLLRPARRPRPVPRARRSDDIAAEIAAEAERLALDPRLIDRPLNVDLSGGEKKKNETLQLGVLRPGDRGARRAGLGPRRRRPAGLRPAHRGRDPAGRRGGTGLGVLAITHYSRLLHELRADVVHVLAKGTIVRSGGPELALELEERGYAGLLGAELAGEDEGTPVSVRPTHRRPVRRPGGPAPIPSPTRWPDPRARPGERPIGSALRARRARW